MDRSTWQDPKTGLPWQCASAGQMSWHAARQYARRLHLDGKTDSYCKTNAYHVRCVRGLKREKTP